MASPRSAATRSGPRNGLAFEVVASPPVCRAGIHEFGDAKIQQLTRRRRAQDVTGLMSRTIKSVAHVGVADLAKELQPLLDHIPSDPPVSNECL
jgi:hypothetical protein